MTYVWQRWLIPELRAAAEAAGLDFYVVEGAENRGRPASTGHFNPQGPLSKHHTGATSSAANPRPTLRTLIVGRPDLPGPLSQVSTGFDGSITVIACGRANHAGQVGKSGVVGMPLGADGNAIALGDEVDTNGLQTLPPAQLKGMAVVDAVVMRHFGKPVEWIHRHQDISGTGKWDIGNITTQQLRDNAAAELEEDPMAGITLDDIREVVAEEVAAAVKPIRKAVRLQAEATRKRAKQSDRTEAERLADVDADLARIIELVDED